MPVVFNYFGVTQYSLKTVSFVTSNENVSSETITMPSVQNGDIAILIQASISSGSAPTDVTPSGFTSLSTDSGVYNVNHQRSSVSYRICDGTEDGSTLTGMLGTVSNYKFVLIFRPSESVSSISITRTYQATLNDPSPQTILADGVYPMIFFALYTSNNPITTRTFNPSADGEIFSLTRAYVKYKIYNSNAVETTIDMGDYDAQAMLSARVNIT